MSCQAKNIVTERPCILCLHTEVALGGDEAGGQIESGNLEFYGMGASGSHGNRDNS